MKHLTIKILTKFIKHSTFNNITKFKIKYCQRTNQKELFMMEGFQYRCVEKNAIIKNCMQNIKHDTQIYLT